MRLISERISVDETKLFSIVILGKAERWKESLLLFWVLSWTFCGSVFVYYYFFVPTYQYELTLLVMIAFWVYFEFRIVKVFLWRRKGYEQVKFEEGNFTIENKLYNKGRKNSYLLSEIEAFKAIESSKRNFFSFMEDSFWIIGGQRLYFNYDGKGVILGMQLSDIEVRKTLLLLNGQLKRSKKEQRMINKQNKSIS